MGSRTKISWADSTWNPVMGCTPVSEACDNCYARSNIARFAGKKGWPASVEAGVTLFPERLEQPLRWKDPRRIFVCSMSDIFHDDVPAWYIDRILEVIAACPQHSFMLLTKRVENIERKLYEPDDEAPIRTLGGGDYLPNVWLGVTAENQARADERIPILLSIPAAVHFISIEPMLGPVNILDYVRGYGRFYTSTALDWVVVGGESGINARPMRRDWVRSVRYECEGAGVPFHFKQWGEWVPCREIDQDKAHAFATESRTWPDGELMFRVGRKHAGRLLDGREWLEFPQRREVKGNG